MVKRHGNKVSQKRGLLRYSSHSWARTLVAIIIAGLLVVLCVYLVRYFIVLPRRERARFDHVDSALSAAFAELPSEYRAEPIERSCHRTGEKYGNGVPFCQLSTSILAKDAGTADKDSGLKVAGYLSALLQGVATSTADDEFGRYYWFSGVSCYMPFAGGIDGAYDLRCNGRVTRYIY